MTGPLSVLRVLGFVDRHDGPYACQMLGDYGAEIIKVEASGGDVMRHSGPMKNPGMGYLYLSTNRSKRSIVIDLKTPEGPDPILKLAADADVLLYNICPQAMARPGLSYEEVSRVNPRLVYLGAFGFS
jgi:crotonobetainyl-CoA:carnitine CoA-transferase CaiB-like acyl-CoA transferase